MCKVQYDIRHMPDVRFVVVNVCRPHKLNKFERFLHQDLHRCTPVWSSKVLYPMHTGMSAIHILILYNLQLHTCKDTYSLNLQYYVSDPVHHCEVHSHIEHPGRKVNPLR